MRALSSLPGIDWLDPLRDLCASVGIALVILKELPKCRVNGATRWLSPERAMIAMSLRHRRNDIFWFTFFHEAGHTLSGRRRRDFVDSADDGTRDADEEAANQFARDVLLPPDDYRRFVAVGDFGVTAVRAFAEQQALAPGIVAGRLERDRHVGPAQLRRLKKTLAFPTG